MLLKEGGELEGNDSTMKVTLNESILTFKKNTLDGLYYTKLKRMRETKNYCNEITHQQDTDEWKVVEPRDKKKWPKMTREEVHQKWGHPHLKQLNKMANFTRSMFMEPTKLHWMWFN